MTTLNPTLIATIVIGTLGILLLAAVWNDIKFYKIPNKLVLSGIFFGILANTFLPEGDGFASILPGALGFIGSIKGLLTGLIVLLPFYLLRGMGAGDVKLVAMIGSILGTNPVLGIILLTFLIGGLLSIIVTIQRKSAKKLFENFWSMAITAHSKMSLKEIPTFNVPAATAGKLPYAVPIATGVVLYIYLVTKFPDLALFIRID